jgi:hypothetical protein
MHPRAGSLAFEDLEKTWGDPAVPSLVTMRLVSAETRNMAEAESVGSAWPS